jgi:ferrous iron transport protein B
VLDDDAESIITNERYNYITGFLKGVYKRKNPDGLTLSDRIDKVVTNRFLALPIFGAIMFLVYFLSVTTVGTWVTDFMNDGLFGEGFHLFGIEAVWIPGIPAVIGNGLEAINCAEWLQSLILDGIVGGVGAVLGFVPQILVLFLFLSFLEASGYMSRIAFVMDRAFRKFGLSGKSFIPMLIGTGCGVPGIMASRTIENESDRRMTIITTTFIPCGAKLPVIALVAGALFDGAWWVAPLAYFVGIAAIVISGIILKKTKPFAGEVAPFVMELPAYHLPTVKNLFYSMWERGFSFIKKAGSVILLSSIVIWLGSSFGSVDGSFGFGLDIALEDTVLGYIGSALGWIFLPLGFSGIETTVATFMGLLAKEEIVAVLGVLDFAGMGRLAGFSFLVFNLLCAPCFAAMGAIKREMNSPKWTAFAIVYQCAFAYAVSLCIYQLGMLFSGNFGWHILGAACSLLIIAFAVYMLIRRGYGVKTVSENKK